MAAGQHSGHVETCGLQTVHVCGKLLSWLCELATLGCFAGRSAEWYARWSDAGHPWTREVAAGVRRSETWAGRHRFGTCPVDAQGCQL